ncbi:hypothetical protein [Persicirhabdus sediminis]|uniref:hypothetical protein n=1 Tax=Persicirhabdus sediminis TaxID=454144 RepID=UPI001F3E1011|nr:hypothetical protein [Persicirhabdus sediminis]
MRQRTLEKGEKTKPEIMALQAQYTAAQASQHEAEEQKAQLIDQLDNLTLLPSTVLVR